MLVKKLAGAITLVEGVAAVLFGVGTGAITGTGVVVSPLLPLAVIGIFLLVDGVICILEKEFAYWIGILMSIVTLGYVVTNVQTWNNPLPYEVFFGVVAVAVMVLDVKAIWAHPPVSEENHPLNLPVFG